MKNIVVGIPVLLISQVIAGRGVAAERKIEPPAQCRNRGMGRAPFAYNRVVITFEGGSTKAACGINCVRELVEKSVPKKVKSFQVADYATLKLIDGKMPAWVIGGSKPPVMSSIAKWAFADGKAADEFIRKFGGRIFDFNAARRAAAN